MRGKELGYYQEKARSPQKRIPKYLEKPVEQLASMRRLLSEDIEMPSINSLDLHLIRIKHPEGTTQEERLRARALKLCKDVVGPQYLKQLCLKYEPSF